MKKAISREMAIDKFCNEMLKHLTKDERESLLLDWWNIDEDDPEFMLLPDALKEEMLTNSTPHKVMKSVYDPLLLIALKYNYRGVHNKYLAKQLYALGLVSCQA